MILASVQEWITEFLDVDVSELALSVEQIVFSIVIVFLMSLLILLMYKLSYQTTVYNRSFAISLPIVALVTNIIIISVSTNVILSLGMVGALSIVRFRTAIKNPFDTVFLFWAVGLGVTAGAGLFPLSIASTFVIGLLIFMLLWLETFVDSYFLIVRLDNTTKDVEQQVMDEIKTIYKKYTLRNKTVKDNSVDLTLEVRNKEDKTLFINQLKQIPGVKSVILLSHQGDYISE
jgi:uncharacterized membrane protein YhiD involved in acid resistance